MARVAEEGQEVNAAQEDRHKCGHAKGIVTCPDGDGAHYHEPDGDTGCPPGRSKHHTQLSLASRRGGLTHGSVPSATWITSSMIRLCASGMPATMAENASRTASDSLFFLAEAFR